MSFSLCNFCADNIEILYKLNNIGIFETMSNILQSFNLFKQETKKEILKGFCYILENANTEIF